MLLHCVPLRILYKVHTSVNVSVISPASKCHTDVIGLYTLLHGSMELWCLCFCGYTYSQDQCNHNALIPSALELVSCLQWFFFFFNTFKQICREYSCPCLLPWGLPTHTKCVCASLWIAVSVLKAVFPSRTSTCCVRARAAPCSSSALEIARRPRFCGCDARARCHLSDFALLFPS